MSKQLDSVPTWLRMTLGTTMPEVFKLEELAFERVQARPGLSRRGFLQSMTVAAAGLAVDPEQLIWTPAKRKNIMLPVASEKEIVVATAHGTRYYMLLEHMGTHAHLFFDSGWRLLHVVARDRFGRGWAVMPLVTPEQAMRLTAETGKTPIELGQMACQKHHGIYDEYTLTESEFAGGVVDRRLVRHGGTSFTVTEVAERIPQPDSGWLAVRAEVDPLLSVPPQQFRDMTPEETVRLVHDAEDQQAGIRRGAPRWHFRAPDGFGFRQLSRV